MVRTNILQRKLNNSRTAEGVCCTSAPFGAMDTGACCVAPQATPRSDDQIVPAHPGDCWNPHQSNHSQPFVDAWLLQMQESSHMETQIGIAATSLFWLQLSPATST
ncbi:hypothetical protein GEV33_007154 [Tenebrio molitor]|uniref:Uncharacterized protein n=1 Tax=Tenebrio molitor TaxID=7067 RepID=A0A8J6HJT2_TENMO|nr:hypothetical protein GEV33_007154 [Tenebrio molitor]